MAGGGRGTVAWVRHSPTSVTATATESMATESTCPRCGTAVRRCYYRDGALVLVDPEPTTFGRLIVMASGLVVGTIGSAPRADGVLGFAPHATVCRPSRPRPKVSHELQR